MTPARKKLLEKMFRHDGGIFDYEACDHERRILLGMAKAGVVSVEEGPDGFCFCVKVIKGGKAA